MKPSIAKALELAFDGKETISGYKAFGRRTDHCLRTGGTKFNHNKIVKIIKFLTNKRMVVQESRGIYRFMPDYHYDTPLDFILKVSIRI